MYRLKIVLVGCKSLGDAEVNLVVDRYERTKSGDITAYRGDKPCAFFGHNAIHTVTAQPLRVPPSQQVLS